MDRDSSHARLLAATSTASPRMEEAEREKKQDKDSYGVRNDAGWSPQASRHRRKTSLSGIRPRLSTAIRLFRFACVFVLLVVLVTAGAIGRIITGKGEFHPGAVVGETRLGTEWVKSAMGTFGWRHKQEQEAKDPVVRRIENRLANPPLPPYRMLAGTMERNESKDILEWLLYHIALGIDHFIVYDHDSDDDTVERLLPFVELGWVTLVPYKEESRWAQPRAFNRFRDDWKTHAKWLFFFDIDEFLVQNTTAVAAADDAGNGSTDFVEWFDRRYGDFGGVSFGRVSFTTGGHYVRPEGGVLASYTDARVYDRNFRAPKIASQARFMQSGGGDIHKQNYTHGMQLVDPLEISGPDRLMSEGDYPIYLNHYWSKSWDECLSRIKQKAFPGSWREQMGQKFCSTEMPLTPEYEAIEHYKNDKLAIEFAPSIQLAVQRFERRYPRLDTKEVSLSVVESSSSSLQEEARPLSHSDRVEAGSTIVVESGEQDLGDLEVTLISSEWKHYLPVHPSRDGAPSFVLPSLPAGADSPSSAELVVRRTYAGSPSALRDPVSPCSIMGHITNQPDRKQLLALQAGECRDTDPDSAYNLATSTWPHPRLRNDELFRGTVELVAPDASLTSQEAANRPRPNGLLTGSGGWHLESYASQANPPSDDTHTRLYTPEKCPSYFDRNYWSSCGDSAELENEGIYRWVPEGHESYKSFSLPAQDVGACLTGRDDASQLEEEETREADSEEERGDKLRILVVGDSVASHTFMALGCLVERVSPSLRVNNHVRFRSFQYEMFDLVNSSLTRSDWLDLLAWSPSPSASSARTEDDAGTRQVDLPDVVLLNVGLWATTWSSLSSYESGLRLAARHLRSILRNEGRLSRRKQMRILWRETTATFPQEGQDPLYQINPRVEVFNDVAKRVLLDPRGDGDYSSSSLSGDWNWTPWSSAAKSRNHRPQGGIEYLPAYEMTRSRVDKARDNAHMCPVVQGDLAELVMHRACAPVLSARRRARREKKRWWRRWVRLVWR
ncbi:hypothetical protein JCM10908_006943 [Rhodotorula pacifica]|uniref:glycosyltransferase family 2 protein n=1 Tax=Rhodotorula pacifica TaxID=1495444 RepID=UPI00317909C8